MREAETVPCVPCAHCDGTGTLVLAPKPPPIAPGTETRACSACKQRFPTRGWGGHSDYDPYGGPDLWWCSPVCYARMTGDTRPWDQPRPPQGRVIYLTMFR